MHSRGPRGLQLLAAFSVPYARYRKNNLTRLLYYLNGVFLLILYECFTFTTYLQGPEDLEGVISRSFRSR